MQQENQHGEQGDESASEQAIGEQPREESADEKEGVGDNPAAQMRGAMGFEPKEALDGD